MRKVQLAAGLKSLVPVLLAMATVTLAGCSTPANSSPEPVATTAVVVKVVDGDTIDIRDEVRGRLRIRVLGIFPVKWAC